MHGLRRALLGVVVALALSVGLPAQSAHTKDRANSYDDAWQGAWVARAKQILAGGAQTQGLVLWIGDSLTRGPGLAAWAQKGNGKTAEDTAVLNWMHAGQSAQGIASIDGFALATPYLCSNRSFTVADGQGSWDFMGATGMPHDTNPVTARQKLLDCGTYPLALTLDTMLAALPPAQFAVVTVNLSAVNPALFVDLDLMFDYLISKKIVPIIMTYTYRASSSFNTMVDTYNAALVAYAQAESLPLIDLNQEMLLRVPFANWIGRFLEPGDDPHYTNGSLTFPATSDPYASGGNPATHATGDALTFNGYGLKAWLLIQKMKEIKAAVVDPPPVSTITVTPSTTFQTMRGWEVVAFADQLRADYNAFAATAIAQVVGAGIDRIRMEVRSGAENPTDYYTPWKNLGFPDSGAERTLWREKRYETINDNGNAATDGGANRWNWREIDDQVDQVVGPLRTAVAATGETLYVNLNYVAFYGAVVPAGTNIHQQTPAEYAEFMYELWAHLQSRNGWVPNAIELVLEPDNTASWSGTILGQLALAVRDRFIAEGLTVPDIIAPSTVNMVTAASWYDQMIALTGVPALLKELSYHRYSNYSVAALQQLANRAQAAWMGTGALECWPGPGAGCPNNFTVLHEDLTVGRAAAYQQATLVSINDPTGFGLAYVNTTTPTVGATTAPTKFLTQYYKRVRRGAVRVGASSTNGALAPVAFRNLNGAYAVVVKATGPVASFTVGGLPAGTYAINYTASSDANPLNPNLIGSHANQTITAGQNLTTSIPNYGALTIYTSSAPPTPPTDCVETAGLWGPGAQPFGWSAWTAINATTETRTRSRTWTQTVAAANGGNACARTGLTVGSTAVETQNESRAITTTIGVTVTGTSLSCNLETEAFEIPPGVGWGVQFSRRLVDSVTAAWTDHGGLVVVPPFRVSRPVALGNYEVRAIWSRPETIDVVISTYVRWACVPQ